MYIGNRTAELSQAAKDVTKKIYKINKKNIILYYFVYLFTICNRRVTENKRLDVLINEKIIL